jgi:hypothetical protein
MDTTTRDRHPGMRDRLDTLTLHTPQYTLSLQHPCCQLRLVTLRQQHFDDKTCKSYICRVALFTM